MFSGYLILFEGTEVTLFSVREDLFAKGDEVEGTDGSVKGTFIGITDAYENCPLIIKSINNYRVSVSDIKRKPINKLEVILTLNGKEIDAKIISKETWENLRRTL